MTASLNPLVPSPAESLATAIAAVHLILWVAILLWLLRQRRLDAGQRLLGLVLATVLPVIGPLLTGWALRNDREPVATPSVEALRPTPDPEDPFPAGYGRPDIVVPVAPATMVVTPEDCMARFHQVLDALDIPAVLEGTHVRYGEMPAAERAMVQPLIDLVDARFPRVAAPAPGN
jgi:hypothetical protein